MVVLSAVAGLKVNDQLVSYVTKFLSVRLKNHVRSHQHALKPKDNATTDFASTYSPNHTNILRSIIQNIINKKYKCRYTQQAPNNKVTPLFFIGVFYSPSLIFPVGSLNLNVKILFTKSLDIFKIDKISGQILYLNKKRNGCRNWWNQGVFLGE